MIRLKANAVRPDSDSDSDCDCDSMAAGCRRLALQARGNARPLMAVSHQDCRTPMTPMAPPALREFLIKSRRFMNFRGVGKRPAGLSLPRPRSTGDGSVSQEQAHPRVEGPASPEAGYNGRARFVARFGRSGTGRISPSTGRCLRRDHQQRTGQHAPCRPPPERVKFCHAPDPRCPPLRPAPAFRSRQ